MSGWFGGNGVLTDEQGDATQVAFFNGATTLDGVPELTWIDGTKTLTIGTGMSTPGTALHIDMAQPGSAGQRDSHAVLIRGTSFDTSGHNADWKAFVGVTSDAGASALTIQSRIDAAAFADVLKITNAGVVQSSHTWSSNQTFSADVIVADGSAAGPSVRRSGQETGLYFTNGFCGITISGVGKFGVSTANAYVGSGAGIGWASSVDPIDAAADTILKRVSTGVLALENLTAAQEFRVSGTTTGPKYVSLKHDGSNGTLNSQAGSLRLSSETIFIVNLNTSGHFFPDGAAQDCGVSSNSWRTGYFSTALVVGTNPATTGQVRLANSQGVMWRNSLNNQDVGIRIDSANILNTDAGSIYPAGVKLSVTSGATKFECDATGVALYGVATVAQHSTTGQTAGFTAGAGTAVKDDSTFTGGVGTKAYTIGDCVRALKNLGVMAAS